MGSKTGMGENIQMEWFMERIERRKGCRGGEWDRKRRKEWYRKEG